MPKNGGRGGRGGRGEDDRTNKIQNIRFNAIREKRRKDKHINTQRKIGVSVAYGQSCVYISRMFSWVEDEELFVSGGGGEDRLPIMRVVGRCD